MKIIPYNCPAKRQVRAKAYASVPDEKPSVPSGTPFPAETRRMPKDKSGLCVSSIPGCIRPDCQQNQHGFFACVYRFSKTTTEVSTDSANEEKKCLVKSGKVTLRRTFFLSPFCHPLSPFKTLQTPCTPMFCQPVTFLMTFPSTIKSNSYAIYI